MSSILSMRHAGAQASWKRGVPYAASSQVAFAAASDPYTHYSVTGVRMPPARGRMFSQQGNAFWKYGIGSYESVGCGPGGCSTCPRSCGEDATNVPSKTVLIVALGLAVGGFIFGWFGGDK